jgi:hypothetical protein
MRIATSPVAMIAGLRSFRVKSAFPSVPRPHAGGRFRQRSDIFTASSTARAPLIAAAEGKVLRNRFHPSTVIDAVRSLRRAVLPSTLFIRVVTWRASKCWMI